MISELRAGDRLVLPGKLDHYLEVLDNRIHAGTIHVFDSERREDNYAEEASIRSKISAGILILHRKGRPRVNIASQFDDIELHAKVRFLHELLRNVYAIQKQLGVSFAAAIPLARKAYVEKPDALASRTFPSRATLFRADRNQRLGLPILKGDKNKGNQTARYSKDLVEFVEECIQHEYLVTESRWTVLDLTRYINREARRRGLHTDNHNISRKFVVVRIQFLTVDADYDRMDPLNRVAGKSFAKVRIRAAFPFARIEQDALHLPFVVRTPHGIARTIYLVHAIDVCTGYPVGWHFVIGAPREMDSLLCLETYLTPVKEAYFKDLGIAHMRNLYGTPSQIVFDNGPEVRGGRIVRLEVLGMDVKYCKAKEAQGKPFIERLNKSLKEALQQLPGCTRFNGKDGQRDPEALGDELMSIEALERWIVRWFYEDWVNTPLDRLRWDELLIDSVKGKTPLERLNYLTEEMGCPIPMPPPCHEWMEALFEHKMCTLSAKTGIALDGFRYKGGAMSYLLSKYGDRAVLHVVYNPDDFRHVYITEGNDFPLVTLTHEHVRPETPAWTFAEAKARFDSGMNDWSVPDEKVQFLSDYDAAVTSNGKARKTKSRSKREDNKETVRQAKNASAIQRTIDRPLSPALQFMSRNDALHTEAVSYDDATLMTIVNKSSGEKLL